MLDEKVLQVAILIWGCVFCAIAAICIFLSSNYDREKRRYLILMESCLLYTSDAADDLTRVDLGGRRIIKKNFFKQKTAYEITTRLVGSEMCIRDRASADPFGKDTSGNPFSGGSYHRAYTNGNGGYQEYHFESGNMDDMFGDMFGDIFGRGMHGSKGEEDFRGFHGFRGYERQRDAKGEDLHAEIAVTFEEAVFGCDKTFTFKDPNSQGVSKSLQVHIPAGIDTGKSIRLRGKGMPGVNGGENGDLFLKVNVGVKAGYERKGSDVYTTVFVPYTTAVFGGETKVQTLYGDVLCKIAKGTQSGTKIRLKGKGIVSMKNPEVRGDQYVTVQIAVPKYLNPEAEQKLREFENVCAGRSSERRKSA